MMMANRTIAVLTPRPEAWTDWCRAQQGVARMNAFGAEGPGWRAHRVATPEGVTGLRFSEVVCLPGYNEAVLRALDVDMRPVRVLAEAL